MPAASAVKTALVRKLLAQSWYVVIVAGLVASAATLWRQKSLEIVYLDKKPIIVEVAGSERAREQGLSGRSGLAKGHGMLFDFDGPAAGCMWMKDMRFPLDAYWYNSSGYLINGRTNLQPSSYPRVYCPEIAASYMLEVNAGEFSRAPQQIVLPVNQ